MGTAYLGVVDCVWQMALAHMDAVRTALQHALVVVIMSLVLGTAVWAICRMISRKIQSPATRTVLSFLIFVTTAYGGTKVVTEIGIRLTKCEADAHKVKLGWETTDERIKPGTAFMVQAQREGELARWETVETTTASNAVIPRFTVDRTHRWRIAVDLGEVQGEEEEGGTE